MGDLHEQKERHPDPPGLFAVDGLCSLSRGTDSSYMLRQQDDSCVDLFHKHNV